MIQVIHDGELRWYQGKGQERVPSVTTILGQVYGKMEWRWTEEQWASDSRRQYHLKRGQLIHSAAYLIASGKGIDPDSIDPDFANAVAQFENFLLRLKVEVVDAERYVWSPKFLFAGRLDLKAWVGSGRRRRLWTIDIKSGKRARLVGAQTAAYRQADLEMLSGHDPTPSGRAALYLGDTPDPKKWVFEPLKDTDDFNHFRRARMAFDSALTLGVI